MSPRTLAAIAERLFTDFLSPLVLGGHLVPGHAIGARAALALGPAPGEPPRALSDPDRVAHVDLARVRRARTIVPVDRVPPLSRAEWTLAAALHDLVVSAHPEFDGPFRRNTPAKLVAHVDRMIERVPNPKTIAQALSRHTWFARVLEISRTDTNVSFWVGSRSYLGRSPPERLLSWPELRRVRIERATRPLVQLPAFGGHVDESIFAATLGAILARTPLTDLATCNRSTPLFVWTNASLGLIATRPGLTAATRVLGSLPPDDVDRALGRATQALRPSPSAGTALSVVLPLLGERALERAIQERAVRSTGDADIRFARQAGAVAALRWMASHPDNLPRANHEAAERSLRAVVEPGFAARLLGEPARG